VALELQRTSSVSDLETVFHAEGSSTAEVETLSAKALLESNGIPTVLVGDPVFPNLPFEIKVDSHQAAWARQLIAEAQLTGPAAAEAAERKFECEHALLPRQACDDSVE
jgi:hypothetical protein